MHAAPTPRPVRRHFNQALPQSARPTLEPCVEKFAYPPLAQSALARCASVMVDNLDLLFRIPETAGLPTGSYHALQLTAPRRLSLIKKTPPAAVGEGAIGARKRMGERGKG